MQCKKVQVVKRRNICITIAQIVKFIFVKI